MSIVKKLDEYTENLDAINAVLTEAQQRLRHWINALACREQTQLVRDVGTVLLHLGCETQRANSAVAAFEGMSRRYDESQARIKELEATVRAMGNVGFARRLES